jgi:16S rRNA (guanine527-N7)-methyltransferase
MSAPSSSDRLGALLAPAARSFAIELSAERLRALGIYAERLLEWNQRINLTGAREIDSLATEHIADAFALVGHLPRAGQCIDVGSGAGLPGLVLAIVRPDLDLTLLEPILKRRAFLAAITRELGMPQIKVSPERLEQHILVRGERYDFAVARAVMPLREWLAAGERLVRQGGILAGLAGGAAEDAPPRAEIHRYDVGAGPRAVVIVRK